MDIAMVTIQMTEADLLRLLERLRGATPCPKHGRAALVICAACRRTVACVGTGCPMPCQCWTAGSP
jgi:hypothetical protein